MGFALLSMAVVMLIQVSKQNIPGFDVLWVSHHAYSTDTPLLWADWLSGGPLVPKLDQLNPDSSPFRKRWTDEAGCGLCLWVPTWSDNFFSLFRSCYRTAGLPSALMTHLDPFPS